MKKSEEINKLKEEIQQLNKTIDSLEYQLDEKRTKYYSENENRQRLEREVKELDGKVFDLENMNRLLSQALCDKFYRGSAILYDEHNPRIVKVVKDGKEIQDMEKMQSIYFHWEAGEFPSVEITR